MEKGGKKDYTPELMVHMKDGLWCMRAGYIELNKITIKDKFPIHGIDESLNELHGDIYFTMLDLCSRYYKIRIKDEDIPKKRFRTHEDHYDFFFMPLALTISPSTFQSLMNSIKEEILNDI